MNPRAPQRAVHFGDVPIKDVFDLRGFNLNAKLDIDPDFLKEEDEHEHDHHHDHDHEHGQRTATIRTIITTTTTVKSFVFRSERAFDPMKLEDFLGAIVNIYGPRMLRYKGVLHMKGTERKVIFQGVHQLMGSDLGPKWADGRGAPVKMVFIGIELPKDIFLQGLEQCLV
jgi:G3E family GTPase